jgi:hypothetical protein
MASVAQVNRADKFAALAQLDQHEVDRICNEKGFHFRSGKLPPGKTVRCFGWQILMGNVPCDAVAHRADGAFTGSAYCQARQRLPLEALKEVSTRVMQQAQGMCKSEQQLWCGHRTFVIDGSGASLPDSREVREHFGVSGKCKPGCGYPTAHLLLMVGSGGVAIDCLCSPLRTGDMTHASKMHAHLQSGDLLMGDRLFSSFFHLHALTVQDLHGLFPLHHSRKIAWGKHADHGANRRFVKTLGWRDQLVEYRKPKKKPDWMSAKSFEQAPEWMRVREVQREITIGGVRRKLTLVTTLTDAKKYPAKALVKLLGERWTIEVNLRSLKTTMGGERLHCQTVDGVKKELLMFLIVYNLVRLLMLQAAEKQKAPVSRISFADALARLRYGSGVWVDLEVNPVRSGRIEPRVVKRRPKAFATMQKSRAQLRKELIQHRRNRAA